MVNILIPDYLNAESVKELRAKKINELLFDKFKIELTNEEWLTDDGLNIINSFLLSDNAKKLLIALAINEADSGIIFAKFIYFWACSYLFTVLMKAHLNKLLFAKAPSGFFAFTTLMFIYFWLYKMISIAVSTINIRNADAKALTKGEYNFLSF